MKIPKDTVKEILDRVNIAEVISEYVSLFKNGRNYIGLCPFHNEKTPSFTVFAESNSAVTGDIYARLAAERLEISAESIIRDILRMEATE